VRIALPNFHYSLDERPAMRFDLRVFEGEQTKSLIGSIMSLVPGSVPAVTENSYEVHGNRQSNQTNGDHPPCMFV
jgi:hypothetical protein